MAKNDTRILRTGCMISDRQRQYKAGTCIKDIPEEVVKRYPEKKLDKMFEEVSEPEKASGSEPRQTTPTKPEKKTDTPSGSGPA